MNEPELTIKNQPLFPVPRSTPLPPYVAVSSPFSLIHFFTSSLFHFFTRSIAVHPTPPTSPFLRLRGDPQPPLRASPRSAAHGAWDA
jgi:hypothetical protein